MLANKILKDKIKLINWGGNWLGVARSWIQWNFFNGDQVNWGSNDFLKTGKSFTVIEIEHFAASVAEATIEELKQNLITDEEKSVLKAFRNPNNWKNEDGKMIFCPDNQKLHFGIAYRFKDGYEFAQFGKQDDSTKNS